MTTHTPGPIDTDSATVCETCGRAVEFVSDPTFADPGRGFWAHR